MSVQSTTSASEPQLLTHSSTEIESKALTSAGSSDYQDVVVERNGFTNLTGQSTSDALSKNATLATASGFSMGATDASVMAGIHEALSKLVNVDVTRRKLNRELTFMEADNIAKKMKLAAEKERKGAALALGMAIGGGMLSIGLGGSMVVAGSKSAKATKMQDRHLNALENKFTEITTPMKNTLKGPDGSIDMPKFDGPDAPKTYASRQHPERKLTAKEATKEQLREVDEFAKGYGILKKPDGNWQLDNHPTNPQPMKKRLDRMSSDEYKLSVGPDLADMKPEKLQSRMVGLQKKVDNEIRLRSLVSETGPKDSGKFGTRNIVRDGDVEHPVEVGAAQKQLMAHESKIAETGYQDQSITNQLKELSRADANLTAMTNMSQIPGQMISTTGNSVADLTYNKEAKELEAEAARDGATQSFFSDNAGTLGSEIQGAMQGIDSVKAYIEVGASIAAGMRA